MRAELQDADVACVGTPPLVCKHNARWGASLPGVDMFRRLAKTAVGVLAISALLPATVFAYSFIYEPYVNNTYTYRINESSFTTNLRGLSVTASQARYWIRWSLTQWGATSGANIITSEGSTTTLGDAISECSNRQSYNFIGVINGCESADDCTDACRADPDCETTWAITYRWQDAPQLTGRIERAQVCLFGQSANWEIDADNFASTEKDLAGVLTHELGHALGLNDYPSTVMQGNTYGHGNTLARIPYGDDIEGIRAMYGQGTNTLKVAIYDNAGGFTWVNTPGTFAFRRYGATILEHPTTGTAYVVHSGPSNGGGDLHFRRTPYPVTAASVWTNKSFSGLGGAWAPPRMVSNASRTIAVWPKKTPFYSNCSGIMVGSTTAAFDNLNQFVLEDSCTLQPVSIAWDPTSSRYIMAYARHSTSNSVNNRIMIRVSTSSTGFLWGAPQDTTIRSSLAPSVACSDGECVLTYNHRSIDPFPFHRAFTVNSASNTVSVSAVTTSIADRSLAPPSAAGRTTGSDVLLMWSNNNDSDVRFEPASSVPVTFDDQYWPSSSARYGGEVGVFADPPATNYFPHIFYVLR